MITISISNQMPKFFLIACVLFTASVQAELAEIGDWHQLQAQSIAMQAPILVMFARSDCDYCKRLEEQQLLPLSRSAEGATLIVRKHTQDLALPPVLLADQRFYPQELVRHFAVEIIPTVLLLNDQGLELARLTGYNGSDFYTLRLEHAIQQARMRLTQTQRSLP